MQHNILPKGGNTDLYLGFIVLKAKDMVQNYVLVHSSSLNTWKLNFTGTKHVNGFEMCYSTCEAFLPTACFKMMPIRHFNKRLLQSANKKGKYNQYQILAILQSHWG